MYILKYDLKEYGQIHSSITIKNETNKMESKLFIAI